MEIRERGPFILRRGLTHTTAVIQNQRWWCLSGGLITAFEPRAREEWTSFGCGPLCFVCVAIQRSGPLTETRRLCDLNLRDPRTGQDHETAVLFPSCRGWLGYVSGVESCVTQKEKPQRDTSAGRKEWPRRACFDWCLQIMGVRRWRGVICEVRHLEPYWLESHWRTLYPTVIMRGRGDREEERGSIFLCS